MLKGKAKTDYMKQYMREYRHKRQDVRPSVRPTTSNDGYDAEDSTVYVPDIDADGNPVYD